MSSLPLIMPAVHDSSNNSLLPKQYIILLGYKATALLIHLCNSLEQCKDELLFESGQLWYKENLARIAQHTAMSESEVRQAKDTLLEEKLIQVRQSKRSFDRATMWSVNFFKLSRLWQFANALQMANKLENEHTLDAWHGWSRENSDIVNEWKHLYPRLGKFEAERKAGKINVTAIAPEVFTKAGKRKEQQENRKPAALCRYVEYWNNLPHVPKCKRDTKAYAFARKFFSHHRHYKAGQASPFILAADVQKYIKLHMINRVPFNALRVGKKNTPVRSHEEMISHIEKAALAFDPAYYPVNKKHLGNLSSFLYRSMGKGGTLSFFLERLEVNEPMLMKTTAHPDLQIEASEDEEDVIMIIETLFNQANGRRPNTEFSDREYNTALKIAREVLSMYDKIPTRTNATLAHHFPDYLRFLDWWKEHCSDHLWQGMPVNAFGIDKNLWRSFIDRINADLGINIFTGEDIY